jgi:hypothetical protein
MSEAQGLIWCCELSQLAWSKGVCTDLSSTCRAVQAGGLVSVLLSHLNERPETS